MNNTSDYTMVFVVHGGALESKSALLAASLARHYRPGKVIARLMEPASLWGSLSPEADRLFDAIGVEIRSSQNRIDPSYPHGNKVNALDGIAGPSIFLDSDMMLMVPFAWHYALNADMAAKPADLDTFSRGGGSWAVVWSLFDRPVPPRTMVASVSREKMRPYFNAGFIAVKDGDQFARTWLECSLRIDAAPKVQNKRPWLDQIALPVAADLLGWKVRELPESLNFPYHLRAPKEPVPYFSHYHWPKVIAGAQPLMKHLRECVSTFPLLAPVLRLDPEMAPVVDRVT